MKLSEKFGSFIFLYYLCSVNQKKNNYGQDTQICREIL